MHIVSRVAPDNAMSFIDYIGQTDNQDRFTKSNSIRLISKLDLAFLPAAQYYCLAA